MQKGGKRFKKRLIAISSDIGYFAIRECNCRLIVALYMLEMHDIGAMTTKKSTW